MKHNLKNLPKRFIYGNQWRVSDLVQRYNETIEHIELLKKELREKIKEYDSYGFSPWRLLNEILGED